MTSSFRPSAAFQRPEFVPARLAIPGGPSGPSSPGAASADVDARIRSAFEEGVAAGRAELPWQEAESLESALQAIEHASSEIQASAQAPVLEMQRAIVELACAIAEHLVGMQVGSDLDALTPLLTESLAMLSGREPLVIALAPEDHATLEAGDARGIRSLAERTGATIEADPAVQPRTARVKGGESIAKIEMSHVIDRLRGFLAELASSPPTAPGAVQ